MSGIRAIRGRSTRSRRPARRSSAFRFLTVSNSHDLERYNTLAVIEAFQEAFTARRRRRLVIKDYGASSGDTTLRNAIAGFEARPPNRVHHRVHRQARADPAVQVVRRVRVGPSWRGLRHEDSRCDGVRASGDHAALRRADSLLERGQHDCPWPFRWFRWGTASIRAPCGSRTSRCGPKSIVESLEGADAKGLRRQQHSSAIGARGRDSAVSALFLGGAAARLIDITTGLQGTRREPRIRRGGCSQSPRPNALRTGSACA